MRQTFWQDDWPAGKCGTQGCLGLSHSDRGRCLVCLDPGDAELAARLVRDRERVVLSGCSVSARWLRALRGAVPPSVELSLDLYCSVLGTGIDFAGAVLQKAVFNLAIVGQGASFSGVEFTERSSFSRAMFGEDADFSGATFRGEAVFQRSKFAAGVSFAGATFGDRASFVGATLGPQASFEGATFGDWARFDQTDLAPGANFQGARFGDENSLGDRDRFAGAEIGSAFDLEAFHERWRQRFRDAHIQKFEQYVADLVETFAHQQREQELELHGYAGEPLIEGIEVVGSYPETMLRFTRRNHASADDTHQTDMPIWIVRDRRSERNRLPIDGRSSDELEEHLNNARGVAGAILSELTHGTY